MMKVQYIGESFGAVSLTSNKIYECLGVELDGNALRIVDDSEEDYLYGVVNPAPWDGSAPGGKWKIIEKEKEKFYKKCRKVALLGATFFWFWSIGERG